MSISCLQAWQEMTALSDEQSVRNYSREIDMSDFTVETELFPKEVLHAYSMWNLEKPATEETQKHFNSTRGGGQGDYREGMSTKINNVVDCLTAFPHSKRALITICNTSTPSHTSDDDAKCMREIHFYVTSENTLNATVLFRAQAALIFPKNIHFIGSLMTEIAQGLPNTPRLGTLYYLTSILVSDRS